MLPCTPIRPFSCLAVTSNVTELVTPRSVRSPVACVVTSAPSAGVDAELDRLREHERRRRELVGRHDRGHGTALSRRVSSLVIEATSTVKSTSVTCVPSIVSVPVDLVGAADGGGVDAEQDLLHPVADLRGVGGDPLARLAAAGAAVVVAGCGLARCRRGDSGGVRGRSTGRGRGRGRRTRRPAACHVVGGLGRQGGVDVGGRELVRAVVEHFGVEEDRPEEQHDQQRSGRAP